MAGERAKKQVVRGLALFPFCWVLFSAVGVIGLDLVGVESDSEINLVFLVASFAALVVAFGRRELTQLGWERPVLGPIGFALGVLFVGLLVGILMISGWYRAEGSDHPLVSIVTSLLILCVGAAWQEVVFRGVIFRVMAQLAPFWAAVVVSSLLFGFAHLLNRDATVLGVVAGPTLTGAWFALLYAWSGRIWLPIGVHAGVNVAAAGLFGLVPLEGIASAVDASVTAPDMWANFHPVSSFPGLIPVALELVALAVGAMLLHRRRHFS